MTMSFSPDSSPTQDPGPRPCSGPGLGLTIVVFAMALGLLGCQRHSATAPASTVTAHPTASKGAAVVAATAHSRSENPGAEALSGSAAGTEHAANDATEDDEADGDDDEDNDYWKDLPFDVHNFDEVLDYVANYYIDANPDKKRAWIEAANMALLSIDPAAELLPEAFYQKRHTSADEEGRLDGKVSPLICNGRAVPGLVLHELPTDEYLKAHRTPRKKGRL